MGCYDELQFIYLTLVSRVTHEHKMPDGVSWLEMEKCLGFQEGPIFMQDEMPRAEKQRRTGRRPHHTFDEVQYLLVIFALISKASL